MLAVPAGFLSIIESSHLSQIESSLEDSRRREITLITSYTFVLEIVKIGRGHKKMTRESRHMEFLNGVFLYTYRKMILTSCH